MFQWEPVEAGTARLTRQQRKRLGRNRLRFRPSHFTLFSRCGLLCDLLADLVHVECLDLSDELFELSGGKRAGLVEHEYAFAEGHDRGDGADVGGRCDSLLGLGVDLGVNDVGMLLRRGFERRCELAARAAPGAQKSTRTTSLPLIVSSKFCWVSVWVATGVLSIVRAVGVCNAPEPLILP